MTISKIFMGKAPDLFRINFVSGKPLEVLLAKFLKSTGGTGKEKVIWALSACYQSIALSQEADVSPGQIQLAATEDIAKLRNQIDYIINYHRFTNGIELTDRLEAFPPDKNVSIIGYPLKPIAAEPIVEQSIEPIVAEPIGTDRLSLEDEIYDYTIFDE